MACFQHFKMLTVLSKGWFWWNWICDRDSVFFIHCTKPYSAYGGNLPLLKYFLKLRKKCAGRSLLFEWKKIIFGCFLKISLQNHVPLPSYSYFIKCFWDGFLCSNICILLRFCDVFMFTQICWFVYVLLLVLCLYVYEMFTLHCGIYEVIMTSGDANLLLVVCLYVYEMFVIHCGIYDVIMTLGDAILWFRLFLRFWPFLNRELTYLVLF